MRKPPKHPYLEHLLKLVAGKMAKMPENNGHLSEEHHETKENSAHPFDHPSNDNIFCHFHNL